MKKRYMIFMLVIIILIIILVIISNKKKNNVNESVIATETNIISEYNNETSAYEIYDESTGELIESVETEEAAEYVVKFYKKYPNYRASPPISYDENYIK